MSAACHEAERLRQCRLVFERGVADDVPMQEAQRRLRVERWAEAEARLAARRCGTALPTRASAAPEQWWQR